MMLTGNVLIDLVTVAVGAEEPLAEQMLVADFFRKAFRSYT